MPIALQDAPAWTLHWLEAEMGLQAWRTRIENEVAAAKAAITAVLPPPRLDILVQGLPGAVIPEIGVGGHAYRRSLLALSFDPANVNFEQSLADQSVRRMVAHEVHHCLRMAAFGYGTTLGEALVSEGLAGQFCRHLFGSAPEPWECAVDDAVLRAHYPDAGQLGSSDYNHAAWFYGTKDGRIPRWLGYTMGYRIVAKWLAVTRGMVVDWVNVSAAEVLDAGGPGLLQSSE